jgi:pyruvate/2-oxoglutarate dehydrogenase complex dihydrolipoamide acyltransferase (E2) component
MAQVVVMPRMGQTMEEATVVEWKKNEGDQVDKGEVLLVIETDKSTLDVESDDAGILAKILVTAENGAVPCFTPIAIMADPGETIDVEKVLAQFQASR